METRSACEQLGTSDRRLGKFHVRDEGLAAEKATARTMPIERAIIRKTRANLSSTGVDGERSMMSRGR